MNAQTTIKPFNAYAAWTRECERNTVMADILQRALTLLGTECDRRHGLGEDVSPIRQFIKAANATAFPAPESFHERAL